MTFLPIVERELREGAAAVGGGLLRGVGGADAEPGGGDFGEEWGG